METETINEELSAKLKKLANEKNVTIISFVAPQEAVRTSPATVSSASIEEKEIYRLEKIVEEATADKKDHSLHLIIQTPGGGLHASYKIANYLRSKFKKISVFVPYEAASGGSLLCCAADELYISELGNLTPIDPQIRYKNTWVSAHSIIRSVNSIVDDYGKMSPEEVSTPWQQMIEKLDPVIYDEMNTLLLTTKVYINRLLKKSGYESEKAIQIAIRLTNTLYSHGYQIMTEQAKEMGFNIKVDDDTMRIYRELVSFRLNTKSTNHCIDYFFNDKLKVEADNKEEDNKIKNEENAKTANENQIQSPVSVGSGREGVE